MTKVTSFLFGIIVGIILSTGSFFVHDTLQTIQIQGQRIQRIEAYLGQLSAALGAR